MRLDRLGWLYLLLATLLEKFQQGICGLSLRCGEKHRSCQSYRGCVADIYPASSAALLIHLRVSGKLHFKPPKFMHSLKSESVRISRIEFMNLV
ncbi:hypothetical protein HED50_06990 [Ochrobactrum oryzae]|nr:hypothetical protein [Brucella oryzae]